MTKNNLFKYLARKEWVKDFLDGALYCQTLQYFQTIEENDVQGDSKEGVSVYQPPTGLQINNLTTGKSFILDNYQFESGAVSSRIHTFCMSRTLSEIIAKKFEAIACAEIIDVRQFCTFVEKNLPAGFVLPYVDNRVRIGHRIRYYDPSETAGNRWALPELIAISKRQKYAWQQEFRLVFGRTGAFDFEHVNIQLKQSEKGGASQQETADPVILQMGDISNICKIHWFQ